MGTPTDKTPMAVSTVAPSMPYAGQTMQTLPAQVPPSAVGAATPPAMYPASALATSSTASRSMCASVGSMAPSSMQTGIVAPAVASMAPPALPSQPIQTYTQGSIAYPAYPSVMFASTGGASAAGAATPPMAPSSAVIQGTGNLSQAANPFATVQGGLMAPQAQAGSDLFSRLDADGSGTITREEFEKAIQQGIVS